MEPIEILSRIESCYREVLRLTEEQEVRLREGDLTAVAELVSAKSQTVGQAQEFLATLKAAGQQGLPGFQEALGRVAAVMTRAVAAEERCRALAPVSTAPPTSHRQVAAAYANAGRGGAQPR